MLFGLWRDAIDGGECGRGDCPKMGMRGFKVRICVPREPDDAAAPPEHDVTRQLQSVCVQTVSVVVSHDDDFYIDLHLQALSQCYPECVCVCLGPHFHLSFSVQPHICGCVWCPSSFVAVCVCVFY